ncbi:type IV toxin-antitoxin system AbiEi family antitoxin [Actinomycetospora callitridis]|uniref:type IV toxin-antitoxin system AbiEi family antitoxin n=1 Tax=Actinomycetospora callitridis TaxID=913944 RepID=UPI0023672241|nr:type IV toxin-antitoxin system AbiEi family antitoxin [Actinomycetospora callitridis]MDD7916272.1 type IV toxin-antitoxin system AbiEi family antitoxin [Actinomycetospora callitridis]
MDLDIPFRGSAAIGAGLTTRRRLRGPGFRELGRDTYVAADVPVDDRMRVRAAALEVPGAVVGGWSALLVHGVDAAPEGARPVELVVGPRHVRRARAGLLLRQDVLGEREVGCVDGVPVTSPIRTAVDLASRAGHVDGVIAVDALAHAFGFHPDELLDHPVLRDNPRGRRRLVAVVADADARAESPPETRMRLILRAAPIPQPVPQLVVHDDAGWFVGRVDFGWRELLTALEYQGDHHRTEKKQWRRDAVRTTELAGCGWLVLPVTAHDLFVDPRGFVHRVRVALARRARELAVPFP